MKRVKIIIILLVVLLSSVLGYFAYHNFNEFKGALPLVKPSPIKVDEKEDSLPLKLQEGFEISVFAKNVPGARVIVKDIRGNFWVSQTKEGKISLIEVKENKAVNVKTVFENLNHPHGLVFDSKDSYTLYIAEEDKISKVKVYSKEPEFKKIIDLPVVYYFIISVTYFSLSKGVWYFKPPCLL